MQNIEKRMGFWAVLGLLAVSSPVWAETFSEKCPDLQSCARAVSELTGQRYVFESDLNGKAFATPNLELNKDNAELLFTNALFFNGYTRVPLTDAGIFQITRQRDGRDSAIPVVPADDKTAPSLPNTWDLMTMKYKVNNPEAVEEIARTMRSFMPANSRIIPVELAGLLLVTDTSANLKKLYEFIRDLDVKPSERVKKSWAERKKRELELLKIRESSEKTGISQKFPAIDPAAIAKPAAKAK
jgi:type II secretory pathway component GspD/PulD (secretin)